MYWVREVTVQVDLMAASRNKCSETTPEVLNLELPEDLSFRMSLDTARLVWTLLDTQSPLGAFGLEAQQFPLMQH